MEVLSFFFSEKQAMKSTLISGSDYVQGNFFTGLDVSGYGGHLTKLNDELQASNQRKCIEKIMYIL